MDTLSIFLVSLSLASDAFAVSLSQGICIKNLKLSQALYFGYYFGGAQFMMTIMGFSLGKSFDKYIGALSSWVSFGILLVLGAKMIYETFNSTQEELSAYKGVLSPQNMLVLAVATSIDALAVGLSMALTQTNIFVLSTMVGVVTFVMSVGGALIGKRAGEYLKVYAERLGGIILICIGIKMLFE